MRVCGTRRSEQPEHRTGSENVIGCHAVERSNARTATLMHHQGEWHIAGNDTPWFSSEFRPETVQDTQEIPLPLYDAFPIAILKPAT